MDAVIMRKCINPRRFIGRIYYDNYQTIYDAYPLARWFIDNENLDRVPHDWTMSLSKQKLKNLKKMCEITLKHVENQPKIRKNPLGFYEFHGRIRDISVCEQLLPCRVPRFYKSGRYGKTYLNTVKQTLDACNFMLENADFACNDTGVSIRFSW